ncbi:MAG: hypothetical protein DRQ58_12765 [Gammaproteobacteria bacterium]|nr:MAG: hypothetical protein DRQ58_12765 [Gammaproteobacteria bacterium]
MLKIFKSKVALSLIVGVPLATVGFTSVAMGGGYVTLRDRIGNAVFDMLDHDDTIEMANGALYAAGPAYSPKKTCGECHDYEAISRSYHIMQGALPGEDGMGTSDTWSSDNSHGTSYKYLANAYGHLVSGGQFGAW